MRSWGAASLAGATCVVSGLTALERMGVVPLNDLAATPAAAARGKVWLVLTCALIADNPVVASLLAFVLLGVLAIAVCGPRLAWTTALVGHSGATMLVYLLLALARVFQPRAFDPLVGHLDFGVSAVLAAWIGAGSAVMWRRHPEPRAHVGVVAFCAGAAALGWTLNSDRTALDLDHVLAFGIGIALATPIEWSRVYAALRLRTATLFVRPVRSTSRS